MSFSDRPPGQRNMRLREALIDRRMTMKQLAVAVGYNVKTVQRWVYEGRLPRRQIAEAAARYLDIDPNWLWPQRRALVHTELINLYADIGDVPPIVWTQTAREARQQVDIAAVTDAGPRYDVVRMARHWVSRGVAVRLCLDSDTASFVDTGACVRVNSIRPVCGIYRFDGQMLVWLNQNGFGADRRSPVLHLRRIEQRGVFDFYQDVFERLWQDSESIARRDKDWFRT